MVQSDRRIGLVLAHFQSRHATSIHHLRPAAHLAVGRPGRCGAPLRTGSHPWPRDGPRTRRAAARRFTTVELLNVTRPNTPTTRLARLTLPVGGRQVPLAFELPYYLADVNPAHRYVMRATLSSSSGELLFTTPQPIPVLSNGAGQPTQIELQRTQLRSNAALENTYWKLIELNGRPVQTFPGEREAHILLFSGHASGSSGCNKLMGRYTVSAGTLRIGPLASTRMACPPAMMEQETTLTATFDRPSSYRITGETLTLFDGDTVLARFEARAFK